MAAAGALPAVTAIELQKKMIKNASLDDFDGDPMKFRLWNTGLRTYMSQISCPIGLERNDGVRAAAYLAAGTTANREVLEQTMLYDAVYSKMKTHHSTICASIPRDPSVAIPHPGSTLYNLIYTEYNPSGELYAMLLDAEHDKICENFKGNWRTYWADIVDVRAKLDDVGNPKTDSLTRMKVLTALRASKDVQWSTFGHTAARRDIPYTLIELNVAGLFEHTGRY